jgi:hypothetical protein
VSSNGGRSDPSCSSSVSQLIRPVTRSMTRAPAVIVASPDLKGRGSAIISSPKSISDASFSIQSAALRPTVTRARTPHRVTTSAWKPLTQPVAMNEGQKCASLTALNPTAKCSRFASTQVAKDPTNHSDSKANSIVPNGDYSIPFQFVFTNCIGICILINLILFQAKRTEMKKL